MKKFLSLGLAALMSVAVTTTALAAENPWTAEKVNTLLSKNKGAAFPIGEYNKTYAPYFTGTSYLSMVKSGTTTVPVVTFVEGAHTFWHIHHKACQLLMGTSGNGYYQIWGQEPQKLTPGKTTSIPAGVKHWHGAAPGETFQHIAIMDNTPGASTEWFEEVDAKEFAKLK